LSSVSFCIVPMSQSPTRIHIPHTTMSSEHIWIKSAWSAETSWRAVLRRLVSRVRRDCIMRWLYRTQEKINKIWYSESFHVNLSKYIGSKPVTG
jgi:hypothetical protein